MLFLIAILVAVCVGVRSAVRFGGLVAVLVYLAAVCAFQNRGLFAVLVLLVL